MYEEFKSHSIAVYSGYIKNDEILTCSSGGLATALSKEWINNGGYVAGVKYNSKFDDVEYKITRDLSELELFKGSKYIDASSSDIFMEIKTLLDKNQKVLFFGLPCRVAALKAFLKKEYENLIAIELVCHGPTYTDVHKQYISMLEKKYKSKIIKFTVRGKIGKWTPSFIIANFENGKVFKKEFYNSEYGIAFNILGLSRCYNCQFKGNNRVGDIQLGDYWGIDRTKKHYNDKGVSCILVHTIKGLDLLKSNDDIELFEESFEDVVNGNRYIIERKKKDNRYEIFKKMLYEKGLFYAVKKNISFKQRIKNNTPYFLKKYFKRIMGK